MDWNQRAIDCRRRAEVVHPLMVEARKKYHKFDLCWSYWANQAVEAQKKFTEVKVIDSKVGRKEIDKAKANLKKLASQMNPSQLEEFIAGLKEEIK